MQPLWDLVVPVKGGPSAKSRLAQPALGLAMAADCVGACLASPLVGRVRVVCGSPETATALLPLTGSTGSALQLILQPAGRPGLAGAVQRGLDACTGPTAVLLADLPAMRPEDLTAALAALAPTPTPSFIPDREGSGTVLLGGPDPLLPHHFGVGSAQAHAQAGARRRDLDLPHLRTDVDTPADLLAALDLGVGEHTRARVGSVQATVLSFDPTTHAGEVVLDDGAALPMDATALVGSGLRLLRPGQRVTIALTPEKDRVIAVRILGIGST